MVEEIESEFQKWPIRGLSCAERRQPCLLERDRKSGMEEVNQSNHQSHPSNAIAGLKSNRSYL